MAVPFDHISSTYDSVFTRSAIGQLQRKHAWRYLEQVMLELEGLEMLELHCGSGEDAMMFSDRGFNLVATDLSVETQKIAQQKEESYSMQRRIGSQYLDLDSFDETLFDKKFDLIFSNFGGLNSISPESFQRLLERIPAMLNPRGRFVGVLMPKFCLWETLYHAAKFKFGKTFSRWTCNEVIGRFDGVYKKAWYYSPSEIKEWSKANFKMVRTKPVGIALPPTSLDSVFLRKKKLLLSLHRFEKKLNRLSICSGMADHFIFDLQVK